MSSVAVRAKLMTGVTYRATSSAMVAKELGVVQQALPLVGESESPHMPPEMALRVVSLPATSRTTRNMVSSSWVSSSLDSSTPSSSAPTRMLIVSSGTPAVARMAWRRSSTMSVR